MSELTTEQTLAALQEECLIQQSPHPWTTFGQTWVEIEIRQGNQIFRIATTNFYRNQIQLREDVIDAARNLIAPDRQRIAELERQVAEVTASRERLRAVALELEESDALGTWWDNGREVPINGDLSDAYWKLTRIDFDPLTPAPESEER